MTSKTTPLRLFMGLQMIGWGAITHIRNPWGLNSGYEGGWMWAVFVIIGGMWMVITAVLELYISQAWPAVWSNPQRVSYRLLSKYTKVGYFFSGAVWGGIGAHAVYQQALQELDFLCPMYVMFLLYLAFNDASKKRKGVELNNENKRHAATAALLRSTMPTVTRIPSERHGR